MCNLNLLPIFDSLKTWRTARVDDIGVRSVCVYDLVLVHLLLGSMNEDNGRLRSSP